MTKPSSIVNFWRAVELFEPKDVSNDNTGNELGKLYDITSDNDLIWRNNTNSKYLYQVFCGIIETSDLIKALEEKLGKDKFEDFGKESGKIAVFTFKIDNSGMPLPESFTLSSWAWALGKHPGDDSAHWLNGFDKDSEELAEYFAQRISLLDFQKEENRKNEFTEFGRETERTNPKSITHLELVNETRLICERLGILEVIEPINVMVKIYEKMHSDSPINSEIDILNSFFQKDLGLVSNEIHSGNYGKGLRSYLADEQDADFSSRIDIRNSIDTLFEKLSPELFPSGHWADKNLFPLAFSQQFAVNSILEKLEGNQSGLFSVNGAPGTGKTTMLKDVIAAVVVNRAKKLAEYSDPAQAFRGSNIPLEVNKFTHWIAPLNNSLKKSGIVIASSNNSAVENVTKEFPTKEKFDEEWQKECEYFSETASHLLGEPAWGLIAAALGNSKNKKAFTQSFWFDKEEGFLQILNNISNQPDETIKKSWQSAVKEFETALENEESIRHDKTNIFRQIVEKEVLRKNLTALDNDKRNFQKESSNLQNQIESKESQKQQFETEQGSLSQQKKANDNNRPSLFSIITSLGKTLKYWKTDDRKIQSDLSKIREKISTVNQDIWQSKSKFEEIEKQINQTNEKYRQNSHRLGEVTEFLKAEYAKNEFYSIPNLEDWSDLDKETERELSAPWFDNEWNLARINVFAKAMQLQKAFILANAKPIKRNLSAMMDILSGKIRGDHNLKGASDAWATLFLVIPVVSTTFASFDKLFKTLGREEIGWLLIDEAGQAVPQAAVGAIWRSQRTVAVGDPLQLEPVSTIPNKMQKTLAEKFIVSDSIWLPGNTSVQELADRANNLGTFIRNGDEKIWVGAPLRVHRRCQNPMFDISNKIAYGEMMIFGTSGKTAYSNLPPSQWIDIKSENSNGHWIPAEGVAAEKLIDSLILEKCDPQHIYLISPFAKVAAKLRQIKNKKKINTSGTIHTTQGKENYVVILVLGGNPDKPGAKAWASAKPNLLNVAVSRAKERIYVIGDRSEWSNFQFFDVLDVTLNNK